MRGPSKPIADPMMRKLVALVQAQLPNSTHHARLSLLAQLHALEREAVQNSTDPGTLRSIHTTQDFVKKCDRMRRSA